MCPFCVLCRAMWSAHGRNRLRTQHNASLMSVILGLDRFSREGVLATLQYLQQLSSYGIGYRSFSEGYPDSCGLFKDAVIGILAVIAKQERVRISERVHRRG